MTLETPPVAGSVTKVTSKMWAHTTKARAATRAASTARSRPSSRGSTDPAMSCSPLIGCTPGGDLRSLSNTVTRDPTQPPCDVLEIARTPTRTRGAIPQDRQTQPTAYELVTGSLLKSSCHVHMWGNSPCNNPVRRPLRWPSLEVGCVPQRRRHTPVPGT